jgi:hypothetical protein
MSEMVADDPVENDTAERGIGGDQGSASRAVAAVTTMWPSAASSELIRRKCLAGQLTPLGACDHQDRERGSVEHRRSLMDSPCRPAC